MNQEKVDMSRTPNNLYRNSSWRNKISNVAQVAGIETSILDNGQGRNTRIAWMNTGSGLRLKLVPDRALDITEAFINAYSLAWISHRGTVPPLRSATHGGEWLRAFGGGLMTTCGLDHVGGPEADGDARRGLHGEISNIPAEIISVVQPNLDDSEPKMSISGKILQSTVFGPHLELTRTISARLGESEFEVHDIVRNVGNQPAPHMLLYHLNFGWPLVDRDTRIIWDGDWESRNSDMDRKIFNPDNDFKTCPDVLELHQGTGEAAVFIDPAAKTDGTYQFGLVNPGLGLEVLVTAQKEQLPALTNWQHFGLREYVVGLEPGTNHPIGQLTAKEQDKLILAQPGETYEYNLKFSVNLK